LKKRFLPEWSRVNKTLLTHQAAVMDLPLPIVREAFELLRTVFSSVFSRSVTPQEERNNTTPRHASTYFSIEWGLSSPSNRGCHGDARVAPSAERPALDLFFSSSVDLPQIFSEAYTPILFIEYFL